MKKIIMGICVVLVVVVGCVFLFSGNGNDNVTTNKANNKKNTFGLEYENVDVTPGVKFNKNKIKKDADVSVIPSCAIDGNDNIYKYDNVEITTNDYGDKEVVYSIYFLDETISTNEGIKIGDSKDDVKRAYPNIDDSVATYTYDKDGVRVMFTIENDVVKAIEYIYIFE